MEETEEKLISKLLAQKMRAEGLSTRDVAKDTDVAHTTIMRVLQGRVVSVKTLQSIARFLDRDPGMFVSLPEQDAEETFAKDLAAIIGREPQLMSVFKDAVAQVKAGNMSADVLKEIMRYAAWRIKEVSEPQEKPTT